MAMAIDNFRVRMSILSASNYATWIIIQASTLPFSGQYFFATNPSPRQPAKASMTWSFQGM
jgi:hypothetical protein